MAITRNAIVELFWRVHPKLYRTRTSRQIPVVVLERRPA
jgi:hypothetical protein